MGGGERKEIGRGKGDQTYWLLLFIISKDTQSFLYVMFMSTFTKVPESIIAYEWYKLTVSNCSGVYPPIEKLILSCILISAFNEISKWSAMIKVYKVYKQLYLIPQVSTLQLRSWRVHYISWSTVRNSLFPPTSLSTYRTCRCEKSTAFCLYLHFFK